jgi:transposase
MTESNRTHDSTIPARCTADCGLVAAPASDEPASLSRAEIAARSLSASTAAEWRRWQLIGLLADGAPLAEIVAATGYRPRTIREIAQRYQASGAAALADRRARSPGAPRLLTPLVEHELWLALQGPAPDGGIWTGPKVAQWIAAKTGKRIFRQRGWEYLRRLAGAKLPTHAERSAVPGREDDVDRFE